VNKGLKVPYSFSGIKGLLTGLEDAIPGAQIIAIAQLIYDAWSEYKTISRQINDLIAAIKLLQTVRDCSKYGTAAQTGPLLVAFSLKKRSEQDGAPASFALDMTNDAMTQFINNHVRTTISGGPETDLGRLSFRPRNFCPLDDPSTASPGSRCLCDVTPSPTMMSSSPCSELWDWLPENQQAGITHKQAVCHPVNCRPHVPGAAVLKFRLDAPLNLISDHALAQFENQIMHKASVLYGGDKYVFSIVSLGVDPSDPEATLVTVEVTDSLLQPVAAPPMDVDTVAHDVHIQLPSRSAASAALVPNSPAGISPAIIIAGGVIGAVAFVALIVAAVLLLRRLWLRRASLQAGDSAYHAM